MRIGVMSDTHDRLPTLQAALDRFADAGLTTVLHAGDIVAPFAAKRLAAFDGTVHVIFGNNDGEHDGLRKVLPQITGGPLRLALDGRQVLMHHALDWCRDEDIARADIIITGHTHEAGAKRQTGKLLLNPGECCGWVSGRASAAILDLQTYDVEWIEIPT